MREIEYGPRNVRETLVELKDSSELAVDLAYSAVLYRKEPLAAEVMELERRVNYLQYHAVIALMLAAKRAADAERLVGIVQVVQAAVATTEAAADVAAIELDGAGIPEAVRAALPEADEVPIRAEVAADSEYAGRRLRDLALETTTGVHLAAIRRGDEWLLTPDGDVTLREGDVLFGSGPNEGVDDVFERATGSPAPSDPGVDADAAALAEAGVDAVELKNIAELAIGLSYGAVLFDSEPIARQVDDLESESDRLTEELEEWVIESGADHAPTPKLRGLLELATASEVICDSARDVADVVLRDVDVHPVFAQAIRDSKEVITTVTVADAGELAGQSLADADVEERTGMTVMAIHGGEDWTFGPDGDAEVAAGDVLIARGPRAGEERLRKLAGA